METPYGKLGCNLIEDGNFSKFEQLLKRLEKERGTKCSTSFQYLFSLANLLNENGVEGYGFIGGYAVLSHLMDKFNPTISTVWRGSEDLDILTKDPTIESVIRGNYKILRKKTPSNIKDKYTLEIVDSEIGRPVHVDLILNGKGETSVDGYKVSEGFWKGIKDVKIYGVDIKVPRLIDLLKLKLGIFVDREKDREDVRDIMDMLLQGEYTAKIISGNLSEEELEKLKMFMKDGKAPTSSFSKAADNLINRITKGK